MSGFKRDIKLASSADRMPGDETRAGGGLRFREERIRVPKGIHCVLKWKDFYGAEIKATVLDISRYGCRVKLPSESTAQKLFIRIRKAVIEIESATAYTGPVIFVNEKSEPDGSISAGVHLELGGCDLDTLSAAVGIQSLGIESDLDRVLTLVDHVKPEFKLMISDLNTLLQEAKQKLDLEEVKIQDAAKSDNHRNRLEERVISVAMSIYRPSLQAILTRFQNYVSGMSVDEDNIHKQYFRLNFQALVKGTPFVERGISKPLGYSGDYGMMVMLYEYMDQGTSLFHRFFHRFVCSEPAAVANRNRVGFLSDILLDAYDQAMKNGAKAFNIASLACGPAREIYEFVRYAPISPACPVKVVLMDSEHFALDYAQSRLRELSVPEKSLELVFLKEDVVTGTLQKKPFLEWIKESDFVISAGLFDYLTDRVSQRMIGALYDYLRPGGQLLIGNISKKSPDVFAMDYFMDWRLILRDEPDLLSLVNPEITTSQGGKADVLAESLGLNLFLRLCRR